MFKALKQKNYWNLVLFFLSVAVFIIYNITSGGSTPYDYFIRLATAFLHGKYYLDSNPSWLNELIPIANNRFAVVYPPAPAIVAIPFVFIFGQSFQQQIISEIMGASAAFVWGMIAYQKSGRKTTSLWVFLIASLGNITWFLSSNGSVWYLGQISAFFFLSLTLFESIGKKRIFLLVLYFGLACLSRIQVVLALPLILYLNLGIFKNINRFLLFFLGLSFFALIYGVYNYLRFGSFIETGYSLIPGVLSEPWYGGSLFSLNHIVSNLRVMFTSLPIFKRSFPFVIPSWGGLAIWITSPVFIYMFGASLRKLQNITAWFSLFLIAMIIFAHGGTGFTQFGYRYAVDFYPLILFLVVDSTADKRLGWHHWFLLSISILINFWGVLFINKFGFVGW